jgi:aspartate/methionine/tyrosine aminotransferase
MGKGTFRICTSASQSIDMAAAYLFRNKMSVGLLQPTFDNLAQIMKRWELEVHAVSEDQIFPLGSQQKLDPTEFDALFVVNPNNPTGSFLSKEQASNLISWCVDNSKLLILDQTFRFFDPNPFDLMAMLEQSQVSFIVIEDTGKTFPTQDMKASIFSYSSDIALAVEAVYEEIFLGVSPFALQVINQFILDAITDGIENVVLKKVREHRQILLDTLQGTFLKPAMKSSLDLSVQWLYIDHPTLTDMDIVHKLAETGLVVLPGRHFFWQDAEQGHSYIRISLLKPEVMFSRACRLFRTEILKLGSELYE